MSTEGLQEEASIQEYSMTGPGSRLRLAREACDWSLEDVARQLRLKPRMIYEMETDDYTNPPRLVFMRGYLRAYAKLVSVPEDEVISAFNALGVEETLQQPVPVLKKVMPSHQRSLKWVMLILSGFLLAGVFFWWYSQKVEPMLGKSMLGGETAMKLEPETKPELTLKPEQPVTPSSDVTGKPAEQRSDNSQMMSSRIVEDLAALDGSKLQSAERRESMSPANEMTQPVTSPQA